MDYQLVLQFPSGSEEEVGRLVALEDDFIEVLEDSADVEGHEPDGEVMNFCIATGDPEDTFERLRPLLNDKGLIATVVVAFRHVDEDDYSMLGPEDETGRKFKTPV